MANTLSINQIGTLIQAVAEQATGRTTITPTNTKDFVAVAQTALLAAAQPDDLRPPGQLSPSAGHPGL